MYTYNADVQRNWEIIEEVKENNKAIKNAKNPQTERAAKITEAYAREIARRGVRSQRGEFSINQSDAEQLLQTISKRIR